MYTWVNFPSHNDETFQYIIKFKKRNYTYEIDYQMKFIKKNRNFAKFFDGKFLNKIELLGRIELRYL